MKNPLLLGVDVGTGSARAGLFTPTGALVGRGEEPIRTWQTTPNHVEQSSDDIWRAICASVKTALRESGDIVIPVNAGVVDASIISADLGELVAGLKADGRPVFFKSSGMAWEDLAIAAAAYKQLSAT